jgi:MurNAc alpha-1-phosphate uridylyltransferase
MLLAAGRGERMRPLTDHTPKPLLPVHGKPLLQWHVEALWRQGLRHAVINTAWLGTQLESHFGDTFTHPTEAAPAYADTLHIAYSHEGRDFGGALETAGGICRALPLLNDIFWVLAGDVYVPGFPFLATQVQSFANSAQLAHIWLVPNPAHNPQGDFGWDASTGLARNTPPATVAHAVAPARYTYSTIGLYRKSFFTAPWCPIAPGNPQGLHAALAPMLRAAMDANLVGASLYTGAWTDVGTPERLEQLNARPKPY